MLFSFFSKSCPAVGHALLILFVNYPVVEFALLFLFVRNFLLLGMLFSFFFIPLQVGVLTSAGAGSEYMTAAEIDTAGDASMQSSAGSGALK